MLTLPRLVLRNLAYHSRGNLAVMLGVAVGSAVLTGALLVGDSLRGSLRDRAERQLGGVRAAAHFPRPVRAEVLPEGRGSIAPVLELAGSIRTAADVTAGSSLGGITVLGVDESFELIGVDGEGIDWSASMGRRGEDKIVLSAPVAARLQVRAGDPVWLSVPRTSDLPRSSALGKRSLDEVTATREFKVAAVLPVHARGNDFNLTPNPAAPLNVWVPLKVLSDLVQNEPGKNREYPTRVNAAFAWKSKTSQWDGELRERLQIEDYGLRLRIPRRKGYVSVESDLLVLPDAVAAAVQGAAQEAERRAEPTVVYIADALTHGSHEIPYPIVVGLNPAAAPPLGPFLPPGVASLADNEVALLKWPKSPLNGLVPGSKLAMTYYNPAIEGEGQVERVELTLRGYLPLSGAADDRDLTPPVKGMTDESARLQDWDRPPILAAARVKARVPDSNPRAGFWTTHKATPMAYVNLATGERLFGSRYGSVTSIRIALAPGETTEQCADRLKPYLLRHLDPASAGFTFTPVRDQLLEASSGGTDFGGLFLGFSSFLIGAALILVGLLFRLTLDRRAKEIGLLLAVGYRVRTVRRLILVEGLTLAVIGSVAGLAAAVGYNRFLLEMLLALWPDPAVATFLRPHTTAQSFVIGFGLTVVMAFVTLWLSVRGLVRIPPPALLRGETTLPEAAASSQQQTAPSGWALGLVLLLTIVGAGSVLAGQSVDNPDFRAMMFFGGGGLLLVAGLLAVRIWLRRGRHRTVSGHGMGTLSRLGVRNAARNPGRSLLTAGLLATAAFLLVAVESFRRVPGSDFLDKAGGSGGFNLIAETDIPVYQPFDQPTGRAELDSRLRDAFTKSPDAAPDARYQTAAQDLSKLAPTDGVPNVVSLRLHGGEDASCLNLFQARRPRVLGVPSALIRRGGFQFYQTEASTPEEKANPWLLLEKPQPDGAVPTFVENNTAVWQLKTGVGGELTLPAQDGKPTRFRIVGTLVDCPFQSELFIADADFLRLFPADDGYRVFLIHTPPGQEAAVSRVLQLALRGDGLTTTPARDRVAGFQAVVNAYLSTFQLLGGFGLMLGVLGLAVVLLRGVWERTGELALLRAVGYRKRAVQFLILAENTSLLIVGLGVGVMAAAISVAPHVLAGATVPWLRLVVMIGFVLAVGLGVAAAATAGVLRVPVIPALRRE